MTTDEQALHIGNLILQRKSLKHLLSCLQAKAYEMSEHQLFVYKMILDQRKRLIEGERIVVEREPRQYVPLTLLSASEVQGMLADIADTTTLFCPRSWSSFYAIYLAS